MNRSILVSLVMTIGLAACGGGSSGDVAAEPDQTSERLVVYTVNYPLAYFAERIGGDLVKVEFPAPSDQDPAYWLPDAANISAYQGADLILLNGAGYAKWVDRATLPISKVVDTSASFADRLIPMVGTTTHSHGPEGEHEHVGWAFTTWLDPALAIQQAEAIEAAVSRLRPEHESEIHRRMELLKDDLSNLDRRFAVAARKIGDTPLVFSHPVYQYLIRRYELNGVEVHWEPDEAPDGSAWDQLEDLMVTHAARWMLWEGEPLAKTVADLEDLGISSVVFDPCGSRPADGDFLTVMAANAAGLEGLLR
jgi:zinc transport system substrate-binding protein